MSVSAIEFASANFFIESPYDQSWRIKFITITQKKFDSILSIFTKIINTRIVYLKYHFKN